MQRFACFVQDPRACSLLQSRSHLRHWVLCPSAWMVTKSLVTCSCQQECANEGSTTMTDHTQRSTSMRWRNYLQRSQRKQQPRASARLACEDARRALGLWRPGGARLGRDGVRNCSSRGYIRLDLDGKGLASAERDTADFCHRSTEDLDHHLMTA